jgi:tetratricopeptide (TPR) repeat protein
MDTRLNKIRKRVAREGTAVPADIEELDQILEADGPSAEILILRGQLMQLVADEEPDALDEALACFRDAIELDPASAEACEELAHFLDDVADEPEEAEVFFRRAIELGAGESAREGLRDVLSQLGRNEE